MLQDYFTEKWLERHQYLQATAKHLQFKDAALVTQEEGEVSAMMFTLLQEQHKLQLDAMAAANQKAMDAMFEPMKAIVMGQGKAADKENAPPANGNASKSTGGTKRNK